MKEKKKESNCVCVKKTKKLPYHDEYICSFHLHKKKQKWFIVRREVGPNIGMKEWIIIRTKAFARASVKEPSSFAGLAGKLAS